MVCEARPRGKPTVCGLHGEHRRHLELMPGEDPSAEGNERRYVGI